MTSKPIVLLTEPITPNVQNYLREFSELRIGKRGTYVTEEALIADVKDVDYLLSMLTCPVSKKVLSNAPKLKLVANFAVGYNNIAIKAAKELGILVSNTPDVLTEATADTTLLLVLSVTRHVFDADLSIRKGEFDGWHPTGFLGMDFRNKIFGIMGMGRIGQAVAKRAKAFGFSIYYHNRQRLAESIEREVDANYVTELDQLLEMSDVFSVHCPLTSENIHRLNASAFSRMKKGSYFINTARGLIHHEHDLATYLHNGHLGGAGLDVFELEPQIDPYLLTAPNTVLLPHIGSATPETRDQIGFLAARAIRLHSEGKAEQIPNLVN